ncbi:MAG: DUF4239 domain-containing protein [Candidatus Competibacteraceae bacterium]|nr:MAG: DUF4239 domain-containing protein [Candidatus Competibacteraceae bacterium]
MPKDAVPALSDATRVFVDDPGATMSLSIYLLMLPSWLAILLLTAIAVSFSIVGFLVVHRFIPVKIRQIHNDVAGFIFATLGVTYGVMLAFVVIVVWQQFNDAEVNAENESSVALLLYKDIITYPNKVASKTMQEVYLGYLRKSVEQPEERPNQRSYEESMATINQLLLIIDGVIPESSHEQILYTQILQNMNELTKYRNLRHQAASSTLPSVIWIGVLVGAIMTIGFTFLFGTENVWAHITMVSLLAALIAVVIYVVIELEYPMIGNVKVGIPYSYHKILEFAAAKS